MSWGAPLPPFVKIVPRMRASISVTKAGTKIHLTASDTFYREMGEPKQVNVLPGVGENAGKVMIVPAEDGALSFVPFERGGARVMIPVIEGVPAEYEFEAIACDVGPIDPANHSVVVTLPVQAWREGVASVEGNAAPAAPAPQAKPDPSNGKPFDIEAYLRKKGHTVTRMSSTLFLIDGRRSGLAQTIFQANVHRKKANLPEISEADLA